MQDNKQAGHTATEHSSWHYEHNHNDTSTNNMPPEGTQEKHRSYKQTAREEGIDKGEEGSGPAQALSPLMRRASWMSLGMMVTRLAWMAQRLVSSKSPTR